MRNRAIGLINLDLPGDGSMHRAVIEDLASAERLDVAGIVTIDDRTYMPVTYLITAAAHARADIIIAPDLAHFGTGYTAITVACALLVPTGHIRCRPRRSEPSSRFECEGSQSHGTT